MRSKNKNITTITTCTGCLACMNKCPKDCIDTIKNQIGHISPIVRENACIDCGICLNVCPENTPVNLSFPANTWAAWSKDKNIREQSSSGALATVCAKEVIEKGGIVYGCAFIPPFTFKHIRCSNTEDITQLKGSKYVQSDISEVYSSISADLKEGLKVLFIGVPCQVAAIKTYFQDHIHLTTIDLVCHGVPPVELLKKSLPKQISNSPFDEVKFRTGTKYCFSIKIKNSTSILYQRPLHKDLFMKGFFTALFYRECCYQCKYARIERSGDITLGDFWGVSDELKTDIDKGISLVLQNTNKGNVLCKAIDNQIAYMKRPLQEAIQGNKQLQKPMKKTFRSRIFKTLYPYFGFHISVALSIPEIYIKNKLISIISKRGNIE